MPRHRRRLLAFATVCAISYAVSIAADPASGWRTLVVLGLVAEACLWVELFGGRRSP